VNVVSLFLVGVLTEGIDNLTVVPLAVAYILGGTHNGNVELTMTCANVVPVDEVYVSEFSAVKLAVLDGHGFASAEEYRTEMSVGVHGGVVTGLVYVSAELRMDRAGMAVLMLFSEIGDELSHNVEKVVLKELEIEGIDVVGALLNHNGAGGVMRSDANGSVLNAGSRNYLADFLGNVVEGGDPAAGLELKLFLKYFEFHYIYPPKFGVPKTSFGHLLNLLLFG